ncbi:MAG: UDP-N-acetylglucosamine--N-acetylmuramyl-(pentapeptide) pyrophosphoryl-undecaprenol [Clostridia bacterium]|jgi:UDP-N-acetylglucosamine--N-acetylmuramyl-(pentapeptide) pyrophosphoryl-undecaprenol N-acetylglucosamine transferase|nr:UDP-N-acetylglucosamine--N-acetylmuramyl-(pentapeptide) pyrophosphoryl-undecaprenol [Clostridia bacterium]
MRVVITCAGTGGHINPGIAIADLIKKNDSKSEIIFIGTANGLENDLVPKAGYKIYNIRTGKILRKLTFKNIKALYNAYVGIKDSETILKEFKADLVIGTGGYICGPVMTASRKLKIPYMLHESNAFPGLAVKMLAKKSACTMVGFEDAIPRLNNMTNVVYTGTPSKFNEEKMFKLNKEACKKELDLANINKKIVFMTFGSQGAKFLNNTILNMIKDNLDEDIFYILVTGKNNYDEIQNKLKESKIDLSKYLRLEKFVYDMDKMYKVSDLCITRAGALTINELVITKKPSILIPLPYATENHQLYNAKVLEKIGCAEIIEEKNLTADLLYSKIKEILGNESRSISMTNNFEKTLKKDVDKSIYEQIQKVINK